MRILLFLALWAFALGCSGDGEEGVESDLQGQRLDAVSGAERAESRLREAEERLSRLLLPLASALTEAQLEKVQWALRDKGRLSTLLSERDSAFRAVESAFLVEGKTEFREDVLRATLPNCTPRRCERTVAQAKESAVLLFRAVRVLASTSRGSEAALAYVSRALRPESDQAGQYVFTQGSGSQGSFHFRRAAEWGREHRELPLAVEMEREVLVGAFARRVTDSLLWNAPRTFRLEEVRTLLRPFPQALEEFDKNENVRRRVHALVEGKELAALSGMPGGFEEGSTSNAAILCTTLSYLPFVRGALSLDLVGVLVTVAKGVRGAFSGMSRVLKNASDARLTGLARLAQDKIVPLATLAIALIDMQHFLNEFAVEGEAGFAVAAAGAALAFVSAAAVLTGGGAIAAAIGVLGSVAQFAGEWVAERKAKKETRESLVDALERSGMTKTAATALVDAEPERLSELRVSLEMDPDAIQSVAGKFPSVLTLTRTQGHSLAGMVRLYSAFEARGMRAHKVFSLVGEQGEAVVVAFDRIVFDGPHDGMQGWLGYLNREADRQENAQMKRAFFAVREYASALAR